MRTVLPQVASQGTGDDVSSRVPLLAADVERVRTLVSAIETRATDDFADYLRTHMADAGLSAKALAARCLVSRPAVGKWLDGTAHPHGKERLKEVGLALGLDEAGVGELLLRQGYPGLSAKNPLDAACRLVLAEHAGRPDIVQLYRALVDKFTLESRRPLAVPLPIATTLLSRSLSAIGGDTEFRQWLVQYGEAFDATAKTALPSRDLARFVELHLGVPSVNELYVADRLPDGVRRVLYPIRSGRDYPHRGLREKLIAFGLWANMTDSDIDRLLGYAKLRPLTPPTGVPTRVDAAILAAMRCGHERCPYYEYTVVRRVLDNVVQVMANRALGDQADVPMLGELKTEYRQRLSRLRDPYAAAYDQQDAAFEDRYADHLSDYVGDILRLLAASGDLTDVEVSPYLELIAKVFPEGETLSENWRG